MNDVSLRNYKKSDSPRVKVAVELVEWELTGNWRCDCHKDFSAELFTVLCNTTAGAAKTYLRQLLELGYSDGFLVLKLLQGKHDVFTKSNMLREFLDVVIRP